MIRTVHRLHPRFATDLAAARDRVRGWTMAAESRAPRPWRDQHHELRRARHGPDRRDVPAHLAARAPDEGGARRRRAKRQRAHPPLHREADHQSGGRARHRARCRVARAGEARGHRALAPGLLRRQTAARDQGRLRAPGVRSARAAARRGSASRSSTTPSSVVSGMRRRRFRRSTRARPGPSGWPDAGPAASRSSADAAVSRSRPWYATTPRRSCTSMRWGAGCSSTGCRSSSSRREQLPLNRAYFLT